MHTSQKLYRYIRDSYLSLHIGYYAAFSFYFFAYYYVTYRLLLTNKKIELIQEKGICLYTKAQVFLYLRRGWK